jgi:hypothetical protein
MQRRVILVTIFVVSFVILLFRVATAAELYGIVYSLGTPIANLSITVKEKQEMKTKTGPKGDYSLQLPPGNFTLIIRGNEYPVNISTVGNRFDIHL